MNEIIINHINLASKMARLKSLSAPPQISFEELESAAFMGLVDAANKFDPKMGFAFSSYARFRIDGEMKDYMRSSFIGSKVRVMNEDEDFLDENQTSDLHIDASCLSEREVKILNFYYIDRRSMKEIGVIERISESRVSQILSLCRNKLKKHFLESEVKI